MTSVALMALAPVASHLKRPSRSRSAIRASVAATQGADSAVTARGDRDSSRRSALLAGLALSFVAAPLPSLAGTPKGPQPGDVAPAFTLPSTSGGELRFFFEHVAAPQFYAAMRLF